MRLLSGTFSAFFLLLAACAFSQAQEVKHAPTAEQCRADQKLWQAKVESAPATRLPDVSFAELSKWEGEMLDCNEVDPERHSEYMSTLGEINAVKSVRLGGFIHRHNLFDQFLAEDTQGMR